MVVQGENGDVLMKDDGKATEIESKLTISLRHIILVPHSYEESEIRKSIRLTVWIETVGISMRILLKIDVITLLLD